MGAEQSQLESNFKDFRQDYITFFVNGKEQTVKTNGCDPEISPRYLLVDYLRDKLGLTGTKYMCREGGCGSCVVTIKSANAASGQDYIRSANSCLVPVYACDGYEITTVEALGNRRVGYNAIQERLVQHYGTQCGFCTPGFVMNMHSVAQSNPRFTPADVEYSFDGNICRCTGYRPIIDAFKSLSTNPSSRINFKCSDIEDSYRCPLKGRNGKNEPLLPQMEIIQLPRKLYLNSPDTGEQWIKVTTLETLYDVLKTYASGRIPYRLIDGNTGSGVYKNDGPYQGFIDINDIPELHFTSLDQTEGLVIGGSVTITTAIDLFEKASQMEGMVYAREFYDHFRRVAALPVRNQGTLAGNLMLKHMHREFISDAFVLFESVGAELTIGTSPALIERCNLLEFLNMDMTGRIILSIHLPYYDKNYVYKCYKLGKRYQNAAAIVNAGMLFTIDPSTFTIVERPRICFGGINPGFAHANATEKFLKGKPLTSSTLKNALSCLRDEVLPDLRPEVGSREYRLGLAQSYLYRFFLSVKGPFINRRLQSGSDDISRAENKARQIFDTDKKLWPLNQPIPKIESYPQASGEAEYINDIRPEVDELFGVFIVSTVAKAQIASIDASKALMMPGVVAFFTAEDIPGTNSFTPFSVEPEEIFAESKISYAGQSIGLLVAMTKSIAFEARSRVVVKYDNIQKPQLDFTGTNSNDLEEHDIDQKAKQFAFPCRGIDNEKSKMHLEKAFKPRDRDCDVDQLASELNILGKVRTVKGEFRTPPQYHFHMETQICLCVPTEDGLDVYSSTQHMDAVQVAIAGCLRVPNNSVKVHVRRLGGAFGAKLSKASQIACASAIAAHLLHKPVRVAMDLETNMEMIGKRLPYLVKYEAKVDDKGRILKMNSDVWCDTGYVGNEPTSLYAMLCMQSCYRAQDWNLKPRYQLTNHASNTFMRSPGSAQGTAAIENIMEHIAYTVNKDALEVRQANFIQKGDPLIGVPGAKLPSENLLPGILAELKVNGEYDARKLEVESFNQNNRWKKKGIAVVTQRFPNHYHEFRYPTFISVYAPDGTVNVSHGGIEMGQGINTKVAQVVAYTLQIPLETVKVTPANNVISPNSNLTAGSVTSELCCSSARMACQQLLERLAPVKKELGNPTWQQLVAGANARDILLTSQFQHMDGDLVSYDIWTAAIVETEIDVLTGDYKIARLDIIEDAGQSLSPFVDIGQVEGALIMGLGWWTTEELVYDQDSGQLLTNNTWHYKPMLPADIPEDLRVTLLRNAPNPYGVLSSKATGEPPLNMACGVVFALRNAIRSARAEVGNRDWFQMDLPVTREVVRKLCLTSAEQFTL